jgi:hypothetical protein
MTFEPHFLTTHIGSVPYPEVDGISERIAAALDIPAWPQCWTKPARRSPSILPAT